MSVTQSRLRQLQLQRAEHVAGTSTGHGTGLTPTEQRIAELAADGLSNREIATAVFISVKTVESTLTRVYRKLGVRSPAMLGRRLLHSGPRDPASGD